MNTFRVALCAALVAAAAALAIPGCGGGGSSNLASGIGGTGKASGSITRFGSIFVNGIEYDIDNASCTVDDSDVTGNCQANLALGMVVTVQGSSGDLTGTASSVVFDANAEGPVASLTTQPDGLTRTLSLLGLPVLVDKVVTQFDDSTPGFSFDTLADGNVVRVSGFLDGTGVLQATYIRKVENNVNLGTTPVKLKGSVANVTGTGGPGSSFTVNGTTVLVLAGTDVASLPGSVVSNGDYVRVEGIITGAASVDAVRVAPESIEIGDDGDEVSLEGLVSGYTGSLTGFLVGGRVVDASGARLQPAGLQLSNGLRVEVEGEIIGNTLVARELEGLSG